MFFKNPVLLIGLGSLSLLLGAFWFQYVVGLQPCQMCLWQRWPHAVVIALSVLFYLIKKRILIAGMGITYIVSFGLGLFHTGVERAWWKGITTCSNTSKDLWALSSDELLTEILEAPIVRCDQVSWSFLSLSMASWNAVFSLFLAFLCWRVYTTFQTSQNR
jgi:disulfide bond formation protein DsbB